MYVQPNWLTALRAPVLGVLITLLGFQMAGFAQFGSTGRIVGVVKDESGAVVPQVSVTATNTETGRNVAVQTTDVGAYVVQGLLPGKYSVIFEKASFSKLTEQQVTVEVNQDSTVDAVLKVGASAQTVTVQAGAELVQNTSAALTSTVDQKRIRELPLNGRDALQLMSLEAGVTLTNVAGNNTSREPLITVNGSRGNSNNVTLNGGPMVDPFQNVSSVLPNPDALQ
jgi:Carboxypeptidase regulatory-like domain